MTWRIEVWVRHKGAAGGHWEQVGGVDTFELAKQAVLGVAERYGVARAHRDGPETEIRGMRASTRLGFCCWTGSGGQ